MSSKKQFIFTAIILLMSVVVIALIINALFNYVIKQMDPRPNHWAEPLKRKGLPNLHQVTPILYWGAQPTAAGMRRLEKMGIKTVINLRSFHSESDKIDDTSLAYKNIYMQSWRPTKQEIVSFLQIVTDKNRSPTFVYCPHHPERTAPLSAIYRVVVNDWTKGEAIREMTQSDFGHPVAWNSLIDFIERLDINEIREQVGTDDLRTAFAVYDRGNKDEAITFYSRVIDSDDFTMDYLAYIYNSRGNAWKEKSDYDKAIADYTEAIELYPYYYKAYYNRGLMLSNKGNYDQAIADYNRTIAIDPQYALVYRARGNAWEQKKVYDKAIADFTKAKEIDRQYTTPYYKPGSAGKQREDYKQAIADYTTAIAIDPNDVNAYNNRGKIWLDMHDYNRAIADFNKAVEINAENAEAYYNRGRAWWEQHEYDRAIADFNRAIEINPQFKMAYYYRAKASLNKGDMDRVILDYTRAIEIDPKFADAYFIRAGAWLTKGNYKQAIDDYTKAIELYPNYYSYHANRGTAYRMNGDYSHAIVDYTKAIELKPEHAFCYYARGNSFYCQGNFQRAIADYKNAIEKKQKYQSIDYPYLNLLRTASKISKEDYNGQVKEFREYIISQRYGQWIRVVSKLYLELDQVTEEDVLAEARKGRDERDIKKRLCDAYYYLGERRLLLGDREGAKKFFRKSIEINIHYSLSDGYNCSKAMLRFMGEGKL